MVEKSAQNLQYTVRSHTQRADFGITVLLATLVVSCPDPTQLTRGEEVWYGVTNRNRVGVKPGLWTLDWTMDWTMD